LRRFNAETSGELMCFDDVGAPNQIRPDGAVPPGAIKVPGVCEDIFGQDGI